MGAASESDLKCPFGDLKGVRLDLANQVLCRVLKIHLI